MLAAERHLVLIAAAAACTLLSACVSPPFVTEGVNKEVTPVDLLETADGEQSADKVLWGGVVISSANTDSTTEIEVLSYPLDYLQRPNPGLRSTGRFLMVLDGYIETADFANGHRVTALGSPGETRTGKIGESEYRYPVLKLAAPTDLHRWSDEEYYNSSPYSPIGIGIGISISN